MSYYNVVFINLGEKCNFQCKYCLQMDNLTDHIPCKKMSPELVDFLIENARKKEAAEGPGARTAIQFWGGEPLLYIEQIKEIVEKLKGHPFLYGTISNGSLLTDEIVDYFNENYISMAISHDGPNTIHTRRRNVFDDPKILERFKRLHSKGISTVISAYNSDLIATREYFVGLLGEDFYINFDELVESWKLPEDLIYVDLDKYSRSLDYIFTEALQRIFSGERHWTISVAQNWVGNWAEVIRTDENLAKLRYLPRCGTVHKMLNTDMDGNIYVCHNSSIKLGHISDPHEKIMETFAPYNTRVLSEKCQNCEVSLMCGGGCLIIKEEYVHRYCEKRKILYGKLLEFMNQLSLRR